MNRKISLTVLAVLLLTLTSLRVYSLGGSPGCGGASCSDMNGYVAYKNVGPTGFLELTDNVLSSAGQTYHNSHDGYLRNIRVKGHRSNGDVICPITVAIYNVNGLNRPTTLITASASTAFTLTDDAAGYRDFAFNTFIDDNFAVIVTYNGGPLNNFHLDYTGDGEGRMEDLSSVAGPITGGNWVSYTTGTYTKDGDFYIVPTFDSYYQANIDASSPCIAVSGTVSFDGAGSCIQQDSMFNTINLNTYSGSNNIYLWTVTGGSYTLMSGSLTGATNTIQFNAAGCYTVTLRVYHDGWNTNCFDESTYEISVGLSSTVTGVTNVSCNIDDYGSYLESNGTATLTVSGGCPGYYVTIEKDGFYYTSASGSGPWTWTSLPPGSYTADIWDSRGDCMSLISMPCLGCEINNSWTIGQPSAIAFGPAVYTTASCGIANGGVQITAGGGTGSIDEFRIDGGAWQPTGVFTGLFGGGHTVEVRDDNGCIQRTIVIVPTVGGPSLLEPFAYDNISCYGGNNGTIVLSSSGGTGAKQYSIDGGLTYQVSGTFTGLVAGSYYIIVKDAIGCIDSYSANPLVLTEPTEMHFEYDWSEPSCFGGDDAEIWFTVSSGGFFPHKYSVDGVTYGLSPEFTGLTAGFYTLYVKDVAECIITDTFTLTQPTQLTIDSILVVDNSCYDYGDGTVEIFVSGATPDYYYEFDGDDGSSNYYTGIYAGTYDVTVWDDNECSVSTTVTVGEPSEIDATFTTTNATCTNSDGGILIVGSGGVGPYTYSFEGSSFSSVNNFTGLSSGVYYFEVMDATGCVQEFSTGVSDTDGPHATLWSVTGVTCYGGADGSITITAVSGGTGVINYSIDGGPFGTSATFSGLEGGFHLIEIRDGVLCTGTIEIFVPEPTAIISSVVVTDAICNGDSSGTVTVTAAGGIGTKNYSLDGTTYQVSNVFTGLPAGSYTVSIRDGALCVHTESFVIAEPSAIVVTAEGFDASCFGSSDGEINISASGGTGPKEYSIDGSPFTSTGVFTGLEAGSYTMTVQDSLGCEAYLVVEVREPSEFSSAATSLANVQCVGSDNGHIEFNITGGTPPYTYDWSTGDTTSSIDSLSPGTYSVYVVDSNGCDFYEEFEISEAAAPLVTNYSLIMAPCGIDLNVTGGVAPYSYIWSGPLGYSSTSQDVDSLVEFGTYTVAVTDSFGCVDTRTVVINPGDCLTGLAHSLEGSVTLYPNPANQSVIVEIFNSNLEAVTITDMAGRVLVNTAITGSRMEINTSRFTAGMYVVTIKSKGQVAHKHLEIIH